MAEAEEPIIFLCGAHQLIGVLHHADPIENLNVVLIVVVGGPQYRVGSHRQFVNTARFLSKGGVTTFRFDYRGMGDSDGAPQAFDSIDEDIDAAVHVIHKRFPGCQIVLMGLCDAASAILMRAAGAELPAAGAVLLNPWVRTQQTAARARAQHYYQGRLVSRAFWRRLLRLEVNPLRAFGGLLRDLAAARRSEGTESQDFLSRMAKGLASTQQPVLLALSSEDLTAKEFQSLVDGSVQWQESLGRRNVVRMDIDGADHTFSDPEALDQVNTTILSWIRQSFAK